MRLIKLFGAVVLPLVVVVGLVVAATAVPQTNAVSQTTAAPPQLTATNFYPNLTFAVPVDIASAGDDRLFIVEKGGTIQVVALDSAAMTATTFLDISSAVESSCPECGLLGLTFHPNYAQNGRFFINYNIAIDHANFKIATRISQFTVSANPDVADAGSEIILLEVGQPYRNHNGGDLAFGPDGYLYAGMGDGGSGGDPDDNGLDATTLLGGMLRLDVDGGGLTPECDPDGNYTIPANNPFVTANDASCNELWAIGLRNPWRFSFDRGSGDLFIGDVGQGLWEEINVQPASSDGGENYGWNCYEGTHLYTGTNSNTALCADFAAYDGPVFDYSHDANAGVNYGRSVTGGFVYRGTQYPNMVGQYLFADYSSANFWSMAHDGAAWQVTPHGTLSGVSGITSFGEDANGELYVATAAGKIYQLGDDTAVPPSLTITKTGPASVSANSTITYTLTVANEGTVVANNLTITDTLPSGSTYVAGGMVAGDTVSWQVPTLAGLETVTATLVISPTQGVIRNDSYGVTAVGGYSVIGTQPVVTIVGGSRVYLPIIQR